MKDLSAETRIALLRPGAATFVELIGNAQDEAGFEAFVLQPDQRLVRQCKKRVGRVERARHAPVADQAAAVLISAAAGNDNLNQIYYPAAYSTTYVNVHSSISFDEATGARSTFSNYATTGSGCAAMPHRSRWSAGTRPSG